VKPDPSQGPGPRVAPAAVAEPLRAPAPTPATTTRRRAIIAAVGPTARVAHLGVAALTVAVAALPAVAGVASGRSDVSTALVVSALLGGAALGWAGDDRAAELLSPLPVSSPLRATLRALSVAGVVAFGSALVALVVALGPGLPDAFPDRLTESVAAAAVALAVAHIAARRGDREVGLVAVTAGVLGPGAIAALALRWPTVLPSFATGTTHDRWWILAAVGAAVALHAGRDPARR
jgi:hypothetical protein